MSTQQTKEWEQKQAEHYDRIASQYQAHYSDEHSQKYRARFLNGPMLEGLDLAGARVLEAMCGSGQTTAFLLSRGARLTGLDVSPQMIASFKRSWPECEAVCASITETGIEADSFDCVVMVGGLHHLHPRVGEALDEIHRILKPGGHLCFMEPHAGSLPDQVRKIWYRYDHFFEKNEAAIDLDDLMRRNASRFEFIKMKYVGNVAYLLVYSSLIFRIPLGLKRYYTPLLLACESLLDPLLGKRLACVALGQWRKKPPPNGPAEVSGESQRLSSGLTRE